jgi:mRNA interferase RelE/StbE
MKTVILSPSAARDLDNLPQDARHQVAEGLFSYAVNGTGDVKKLEGRQGYRLHIGRYRVIFDEDRTTILAIYIGKRESVTYRRQ